MKFGKQLEEYEQPEWRGHYINYKHFKQRLQEIKALTSSTPPPTPTPVNRPQMQQKRRPSAILDAMRLTKSPGQAHADFEEGVPLTTDGLTLDWRQCLEAEAIRVGDFVQRGLEGLEAQLKDLDKMGQKLHEKRSKTACLTRANSSCSEDESSMRGDGGAEEFLELRVLEAVGLVAEGGRRLRNFAELNHAALYKILKKHDKVLGYKIGLSELFPRLVGETRLSDTARFDALDAELRRLSLLTSQTEGLDASAEVARLAAGLGMSKAGTAGAATGGARHTELVLSFFLGCSTALFLCIGVLLALPEASPKSFSTAYFLTPMPVFRVVFSVLLTLWCMGAVARTCDKADINHMFILNIDPRCRVSPDFFFSRAATLTTLWILIFGMYVVDYKWRILPAIWSDRGYNKRSSVHFLLYPVVLLTLTLVGMIWPSRICRSRYKASLLRSVARTAAAPLYAVDFADNIVGDILTSLAKPMQDVPAAVCYLVSAHPQPEELVERFAVKGDTCSEDTHHIMLPIIGGLPYVFRALQCLRRYRDTREARHLWNFGKYSASLTVVVVSSVWYDSMLVIAVVSAVATVYAGIWDVCLDWGLGWHELKMCRSKCDKLARTRSRGDPDVTPESGGGVDSKKSTGQASHERHFPTRLYWLCSAVDLIARSTWVLTLMPITIVSRNIVGRVVLVSLISSVEILRRSMWAVLRIEHEQVANASGFRALLWVPSKLHVNGRRAASQPQRKSSTSSLREASLREPLLDS